MKIAETTRQYSPTKFEQNIPSDSTQPDDDVLSTGAEKAQEDCTQHDEAYWRQLTLEKCSKKLAQNLVSVLMCGETYPREAERETARKTNLTWKNVYDNAILDPVCQSRKAYWVWPATMPVSSVVAVLKEVKSCQTPET